MRHGVEYALAQGKRVIAVLGGHMHHRLKGGGQRRRHLTQDNVHYVNAARVPRIFDQDGVTRRHHVCLRFDALTAIVKEVLV